MSVFHSEANVVRHYLPGGTEHGGGIGRLVRYIQTAPDLSLRHEVVDTRGPRWSALASPLMLARALGALVSGRVMDPGAVHHLHVAGRGSTARKVVLGLAAQAIGARYVLHLHDYDYATDFERRPDWQRGLIRNLFGGAQHVIVLGERDRATVETLLGVPRDRVSVLRNCVTDPGRKAPTEPGDTVRILFLGTLGERKGVPELLAAFSDAAMPQAGWSATLAGDGDVEKYTAEVQSRGLGDRVSLPGWLDSDTTHALCASADILVLPSHGEGFAMAILEGLAHGLAVVATRVGAHDELLEHERTCLFVPVGDVPALAAALSELIEDAHLRDRLAEEGRRLFLSEFSMDGYVRRLEALLTSLSGQRLEEVRSA
ncbi:glycosyltransferase family 4 protein [Tropicimonas isoalkanivorans]|uniref:Glycosyltransferase involved in cell wall bisynthesis n=1 Tax=Tropicimonas isoalkanivorans TaxID=441112 RepID=A0A1I1LW18_9RHOB|nr:glycosyltransferase family 4 protein [Tropicimonas isoalkanivorans]SFC73680.1 Glycosyltransferase involved in cell wall bisynthesis [Tropicimonas isoalkanivorans]